MVWIFLLSKSAILMEAHMVTIAVVISIYSFVESSYVNASGAIAVLTFGLMLGNSIPIINFFKCRQFVKILKKEGLSNIETVGEPFDPNKHEAVNRVHVEGKDGIIIEEVRKGFTLKDKVIRPSLVIVAVNTEKKGEKR
jgi:hypothetical protein